MIRGIGLLAIAGLVLAGCGSISSSTAVATWVAQSDYPSAVKILTKDALNSANALKNPSTSSVDLHTVCGVLLVDSETANASLPTPDSRATTLLGDAYDNLGAGANECYVAAGNAAEHAKALASLAKGLGELSEASARLTSASTP